MSSDDLSDVIPIGVTIGISDGVQEMKFGRRICEIRGYGENGWTRDQMLDYFEDLCRVYDAWAESKRPWILPDNFDDLVLPDGIKHDGFNTGHQLKNFVAKCYEKYVPHSICGILLKLKVPIMDWYQSVHHGRIPPRVLTPKALCMIEQHYTAVTPATEIKELIAETGLTRRMIETLGEMFKGRRIALYGETALLVDRAPQMLKQLLREGELRNYECIKEIQATTGVKYSKSYVSKMRKQVNEEYHNR